MRTFILFLFIVFSVNGAIAQYTTTVNATGAVGSYKTGYTSNGSGRTDGNMTVSVNTIRGYAVFDLAGIVPPGATVTSATLRFTYTTTGAGTGVTCNIYGYPGDLSTVTNATTLYSNCSTGTVCNTGNWGAATGGTTVTRTLAAAGNTFLAAQAGNKISLCFVTSSSSNQYTITGEGGSAATIPQLVITYTCAGLSAATATTSSSTLCTGATLSLTGAITGATTYSWIGPNSFSRTIQNPSLSVVPASAGNYTFTATNSAGCYYKAVTTPSVTVNAQPTVASITPSATTICTFSSLTLTAGATTGPGTITSYNWTGPASYNTTTTATTVVITPTTTAAGGVYSLSVTYPGTGCTSPIVSTSPSVTVNALPTLAGITPPADTINEDDTVVLTAGAVTGTGSIISYNWSGPNAYSFSGTSAADTIIPLPPGGIYTLTVTYPGAGCTSAQVTSSVTVNYLPPTITSVTPNTGNPGTTVIIRGTKFDNTTANDIVYFGATRATVSAASDTSLTVTVPSGATYSKVSVLNITSHLGASAPYRFLPTFNNSAYVPGTMNFADSLSFFFSSSTTPAPDDAAISDLDGDGKPDIIVASRYGSKISILPNISASGSITGSSFGAMINLAANSPERMVICDLDGDGKPDIAAITFTTNVSIFRNTSSVGSISFATAVSIGVSAFLGLSAIAIADLNGDGKPDIVGRSSSDDSVYVCRNTGSSFSAPIRFGVGYGGTDITIDDIDGDGKPDLAIVRDDQILSIMRNTTVTGDPNISFAARVNFTLPFYLRSIAIADLNGDSKPDIVICGTVMSSYGTNISILRNTATIGSITGSSFATHVDFASSNDYTGVSIGDMDGDGWPDLAVTNGADKTVSVLRNRATGSGITTSSFAFCALKSTGGSPNALVSIGDLDGDGKPDMVVVNSNRTISVFRNKPLVNAGAITGVATVCGIWTTTLSDTISGGIWISSDPAMATVSNAGVVTGYAAGTVTISYMVIAAGDTGIATKLITMSALPTVAGITPSANTICTGTPLTLTAGAVTGPGTLTSYNWTGPDGYSVTSTSVTAVRTPTNTAAGGNYSLTVTYSGTNCTSLPVVTSPSVTVNDKPVVAGIIPSTNIICTGAQLTLTAGAVTGTGTLTSYNWTGPAGYSATGTINYIVYIPTSTTASGNYSVSVIYPGTGCTSLPVATSPSVTVRTLPTVASVATSTSTICTGTSLTLTAGAVTGTGTLTSYNWTGPNAFSTTGTATIKVFTPAVTAASGVYSLTVTYPGTGCTSAFVTTSSSVTVNDRPTIASITPSTNTICVGSPLTLTAGAVTGIGTLTSYNWTGPGSYSVTGTSATAVRTVAGSSAGGNYSLSVTYPGTGCTSAFAITSPSVTAYALPAIAGITPSTNTLCIGPSLTFTAGAVAGGGTLISYNWTGPAGYSATGTSNNIVYTPTGTAASGSYSVSVTYTGTGCTSTLAVTSPSVSVRALPTVASITPSTNTICTGTPLTFSAGTVIGTGTLTSYNWTGPNAYSATGTAAIKVFTPAVTTASGVYSLTVTYPGTGCTSAFVTTSPSVTVNDRPTVADITPSTTTICTGNQLTLTAGAVTGTGSLTSYNWTGPGSYSASGTAATAVRTPTNTTAGGVYSLSVTYPGSGCTSTLVTTSPSVTVNNLPTIAGITSSTNTICTGASLTLTAGSKTGTGTFMSYNWTGPNGYSATTAAATTVNTPTIASTGKYSLSVTYAGSGCTSAMVATSTVTVNAVPGVASITPSSTTVCTSSPLTLTAGAVTGTDTLTSYNWSGPNGYSATGISTNAVLTPTTTAAGGLYSLTVTYQGAGCTSTAAVTSSSVTVIARPSVTDITPSVTTICAGSSLTLTAGTATGTGTLTSYNWTGPAGYNTSGTVPTAVRIPTNTTAGGVYSLSVTYPGSGCTSPFVTTSPSVTVNNRPTIASITPSATTVCIGALLTLTAGTKTGTGTFLSYNWSGPNSYSATTVGATSVFTPTNVASTGKYSLSVTYAGSGCTSTVTATSTVSVNALPTIASITPSATTLCTGNALTLTAGAVTGSGTLTSYNWSGPNSYSSSGNSAIKVFTPAVIAASGVYSLTVTYPGSGCRSTAAVTSPSVTVNTVPVVGTITGGTLACIGNSITLSDTTGGGVWSSSDPAVATINSGIVTGLASGTSVISYSVTNGCGTTVASVPFNVGAMEWQGTTSTDWNTASNWSCGAVPNITGDVFIPVTSSQPVIGLSCDVKDIFITSGALLTVNGGAAMHVKGHMTNNSIVSGNGAVILDGSTAQTIDGQGIVDNLELDNINGATINGGARVVVNKVLTLTNGTLNTGDSLVLASNDISGSARIAPITTGAAVTGNVQVQQYVQGGYRRYRFMSHPFSTAISLGQLQNSIDITGTGGAANGFTTTGSNAASAFRYDPYTSNSTLSYDAGWKPYTDISSVAADTNKFNRYQGIRLFLRGSKGEGLGYWFTYTPSPTIIGMTGPVNQGDQTITLSKGSGTIAGAPVQDYNMVGNPYPSPVDIGTVLYNASIANQIVGAAFYVWNPSIGASGQYQAIPISASPYYIQANTAFQVRAHHDNAVLNFTENNKSANATSYLFKTQSDELSLSVYDINYHPWDKLTVKFNDVATDADDNYLDAVKPSGADFNFYSLSPDNKKMVIDSRRYDADRVVPLGISTAYTQEFIIKAESVSKEQVYLHDKLLEKYVLLEAGTEYRFTTTKGKSTQGENRFELGMKPATVANFKGLEVIMTPNPATDEVKVKFASTKASNVNVRVLDMSGVSVYNEDLGMQQNGIVALPINKLASGIYMVELTCGDEKVVQRLVKE